jgi:hypothetical protein
VNEFSPSQENEIGVSNEAAVIQNVVNPVINGQLVVGPTNNAIENVTINQGNQNVFGVNTQLAVANQSCGTPAQTAVTPPADDNGKKLRKLSDDARVTTLEATGASLTCINISHPVQSNFIGVKNAAAVVQSVSEVVPAVQVVPAVAVAAAPQAVPVAIVPALAAAVPVGRVGLPATGSGTSRITSATRPDEIGMLLPQLIAGLLLLMAGLGLFAHQKVSRQIMHRRLA